MSRCYCDDDGYTCVTCALRRDRRGRRRDVAIVAVLMAAMAAILGWAQSARAGVNPPCQVTGHLVATPGHVTAVFHVAETCREVSLLSWLAPDAHAGNPQVLYDRRSQSDVAPGDYRWTITTPPPGCYFQYDLRVPGHNVDAILGGTKKCSQIPTTTTTSPSTTTTAIASTTSTSTMAAPSTSTSIPLGTTTTLLSGATNKTLPHSGNGEVGAMTAAALGLIGAGRWVEGRGKRRRAGR